MVHRSVHDPCRRRRPLALGGLIGVAMHRGAMSGALAVCAAMAFHAAVINPMLLEYQVQNGYSAIVGPQTLNAGTSTNLTAL